MIHTGTPGFAATYVINLPRSSDRWETLQPVLDRMNLSNVIRFAGIDGRALGVEGIRQLQESGRLAEDLTQFDSGCADGEIGCALSHAAALRDIMEREWPSALILEDDVVLAGNPDTWLRRFERAFADLPPSWELWYLYRCLDVRHRTRRITRRTAIPWTPLGGAAYAVTQAGARKLLTAMTPTASAVDRVYAESVSKRAVDAWAASPRLILPGSHASIINRENPSKRWVENGINRPPEYWPPEYLGHLGEEDPHPHWTRAAKWMDAAGSAVRSRFASGTQSPQPNSPTRTVYPRRVYLAVWWFADSGGLERHLTELAVGLAGQGLDVTVFSELPVSASNQYALQLRENGVRVVAPGSVLGLVDRIGTYNLGRVRGWLERLQGIVHRLRRGVEKTTKGPDWTPADEQLLDNHCFHPLTRSMMRSLSRAALQAPPDVVHLHGCRFGQSWVLEWAAAHGYPSVYTEHTSMADWGGPFDAEGASAAGRSADLLSCVSESARAGMLAALPEPRAIHIARHIIRGPAEWAPPRAKVSNVARVLCVARLARHKGIDVLLEALGMLQREGVRFELEIAGEGEERNNLEQLAARLEITGSVRFLGEVEHARISALWKHADIGVLPSRTEGLPLSVVEAMAQGRAVVASRVGGIPEVIRHEENGLLVEPDDAAGFRDALRRVIQERDLRESLGAAARQSFESGGWSEQEVVAGALSMYEQAREKRVAMEEFKKRWRARIEELGKRRSMVLHERMRESLTGIRRVYFVLEKIVTTWEMEKLLVERAVALASVGVDVAILSGMPVYWDRRHTRRMRRVGVRVMGPSQVELLRRRFIQDPGESRMEKAANIAAARVAMALDGECSRNRPDAIHVYGRYQNPNGASQNRVGAVAEARQIPLVYSEETDETQAADNPEGTAVQREWEAELRRVDGFTAEEAAAAISQVIAMSSSECRELELVYRATEPYRRVASGEYVTGGERRAHG